MTEKEKVYLLEEMFEADPDSLRSTTGLDSLNWDSMAFLSLIVLVNDNFGKKLTSQQIRSFKTIGDILAIME